MPCYFPIYLNHGLKPGDRVQGKTNRAPDQVPCGKCMGCIKSNAIAWATRCYHESRMWENNCFVTLTYDDDRLPDDLSLDKRHLQGYIKKLRNVYGEGIRFYGIGEYGEINQRPHYHVLLFNHAFPDLKRWKMNSKEKITYLSESCREIWGKGHITIGNVDMASAMYCALYSQKVTINDQGQRLHYKDKEQEFALMSKQPGIGRPWIDKYYSDTYKGFFTIAGTKYPTNKYYDAVMARKNPKVYARSKDERRRLAEKADPGLVRRNDINQVKKILKSRRGRPLDNDRKSVFDLGQKDSDISSTTIPHV